MCNNQSADVTELRWKVFCSSLKKNLNMHTVAVEDQLYLEDDIFSDSVWHFLLYSYQATENDFNASKCHLSIFLMQLICNRVPTKFRAIPLKQSDVSEKYSQHWLWGMWCLLNGLYITFTTYFLSITYQILCHPNCIEMIVMRNCSFSIYE